MRILKNAYVLITLLLIQSFLVDVWATPPVLNRKISIHITDKPIEDILSHIEKVADITFSYNSEILNSSQRQSIHFDNKSLKEVLYYLLQDEHISFTQIGSQIILHPARETVREQYSTEFLEFNIPLFYENVKANSKAGAVNSSNRVSIIDTVVVYDTIKVSKIDTVRVFRYDTVKIATQIMPSEIEMYIAPFINSTKQKHNESRLRSDELLSFSAGVNARVWHNGKWSLNAGAGYSLNRIKEEYSSSYVVTDSVENPSASYTLELVNEYYQKVSSVELTEYLVQIRNLIDSLEITENNLSIYLSTIDRHDWMWNYYFNERESVRQQLYYWRSEENRINYELINHEDSVLVREYEKVYNEDERYFYNIDSVNLNVKNTLTAHYIYFPLDVRYQLLQNKNHSFELGAGCFLQFLLASKGNVMALNDSGYYEIKPYKDFLHKVMISTSVFCRYNYESKTNRIFIEPFYSSNMLVNKMEMEAQKSFGVKVGIVVPLK